MVSSIASIEFFLIFLSALVLFQCLKKPKKKDKMSKREPEVLKKEANTNKECNENKKSITATSESVLKKLETKLRDRSEQKEQKIDDVDKTQDERTKENTKTGNEDYEKVTDEKIADMFKSDTSDDRTASQKKDTKMLITIAPKRMIWRETSGTQVDTLRYTEETKAGISMSPIFGKIEPQKSIEIRITREEAPQAPDRISAVAAILMTTANTEKEIQTFFKNYHGKCYEANLTLLPDRL